MQIPLPDFLHPVTAGAPVYCGTASGGGTPGRSLVLERGFHFVLCTGGSALIAEGADTAVPKAGEPLCAADSRDTDKGDREKGDKGGAAGSKPRKGERRLQQGDLLLLSPSRTATLRLDGAHDTLECICIDPDYFDTLPDGQPLYNQLSGYLGDDRLPVVRLDGTQYGALRLTASLFPAHPAGSGLYDEAILRHLCSLFLLQTAGLLYRHRANAPAFVKRPNEIFRSFKRLAVKNYRTAHDIAFYAGRLHISPTYLSRIVKQVTGHTVKAHLAELLCADARRLLSCSDLDIKEIADTLGFSDQSAFGKFFVRQTGCSPLRFRRERATR
ncbi:helix-turn-helix domain-containing protein [uncultured Alistipes sp.]|uniref:helix-turn-helix domain-containing protein n=1 Tax=uncultured Alistipes sp. TaxID=538949 RepID=UPI002804911C|nr:helix-turn-helix domain-containing protein [uncultured Alistipes sp.]